MKYTIRHLDKRLFKSQYDRHIAKVTTDVKITYSKNIINLAMKDLNLDIEATMIRCCQPAL